MFSVRAEKVVLLGSGWLAKVSTRRAGGEQRGLWQEVGIARK